MKEIIYNPEQVWDVLVNNQMHEVLVGSSTAEEDDFDAGSVTEIYAYMDNDNGGVNIDVLIDGDLVDGDWNINDKYDCEKDLQLFFDTYFDDELKEEPEYDPLVEFSRFFEGFYSDEDEPDEDDQSSREYELTDATMGFLSVVLGDSFNETECPPDVIEDCKEAFLRFLVTKHGYTEIYRPMMVNDYDGESFMSSYPYAHLTY